MKPTSNARPLVLGYLERISSAAFSDFREHVKQLVGGEQGIYALYKRDRLYYVGLASDLRRRVNHHLKDRHAGKWDHFSLYLVNRFDHIRELEALAIRLANPKGNRAVGKLKGAQDLASAFRQQITTQQKEELERMFGEIAKRKSPHPKKDARGASSAGSRTATLSQYVSGRFRIKAIYKSKPYYAHVRSDGTINYDGQIFTSPSLAGKAVVKRACDGWKFWRYRNKDKEWVRLDELRK